ncbi:hypothetical protein [Bellilinea caldifistulae]|uniref:hypothetical protein n=1 Tax=Bellilinea caldifistulae TaxID=360411 RepID=UPI0011AE3C8B
MQIHRLNIAGMDINAILNPIPDAIVARIFPAEGHFGDGQHQIPPVSFFELGIERGSLIAINFGGSYAPKAGQRHFGFRQSGRKQPIQAQGQAEKCQRTDAGEFEKFAAGNLGKMGRKQAKHQTQGSIMDVDQRANRGKIEQPGGIFGA